MTLAFIRGMRNDPLSDDEVSPAERHGRVAAAAAVGVRASPNVAISHFSPPPVKQRGHS